MDWSEDIRMALISAAWLDLWFSLAMSKCHDAIAYDGPFQLFLTSTLVFK